MYFVVLLQRYIQQGSRVPPLGSWYALVFPGAVVWVENTPYNKK